MKREGRRRWGGEEGGQEEVGRWRGHEGRLMEKEMGGGGRGGEKQGRKQKWSRGE